MAKRKPAKSSATNRTTAALVAAGSLTAGAAGPVAIAAALAAALRAALEHLVQTLAGLALVHGVAIAAIETDGRDDAGAATAGTARAGEEEAWCVTVELLFKGRRIVADRNGGKRVART